MPKQQFDHLMSRLHDSIAPGQTSDLQQVLLADLARHANTPGSTPDAHKTANVLLEELSAEHPQTAAILQEIIVTLGRMGL